MDQILGDKFLHYSKLMRLDRPIGSLLLLWPTLWALWIAGDGHPPAHIVLIFVVGTFVMRAAGCVINDYMDRDVDPNVERTHDRPLATGTVKPTEALVLFVVLGLIALSLVLLLNRTTLLFACAGIFLATTYPFFKRFTYLPQVYLGIAFGWGIPMAFAAILGAVPLIGWLLLLANIVWVMAYDTWYAIVDRPDDIKIGVKSSAILFGEHDLLIVGIFQVTTLFLLMVIGLILGLNGYYYTGLLLAAGFSVYQQILCRERVPAQCFKAFMNNAWYGAVVYGGILLAYL